jgi:glycosyltransferase involved in cell wall biosynthesis
VHICFLCNEYPPGLHGGIGSFTQTLARALVANGQQVTVVGVYKLKSAAVEDDQGVRVIRLRQSPVARTGFVINGFRIRQALVEIHRTQPINIVEGPELSLAVLPNQFPAVTVIRMHGGHHFFSQTLGRTPRPWRSWQETRSFRNAARLCAVSRFVAEKTAVLLGFDNREAVVLPNPVDTCLFAPRPEIPEQESRIVFVGAICEKKGIRQLIQAMPRIVAHVPDARLAVIGRDTKDRSTGSSYGERLRSIIPSHVKDRIEFTGPVEQTALPATMASAMVCVYPSHMEAMGIVLAEGMAMAKAVIGPSTGPGPEIIEDGVSGLLCDPYNPDSIAEKVIQVLKNPELRRSLGLSARIRATEHFAVDRLIGRNLDFYHSCIEEKNGFHQDGFAA